MSIESKPSEASPKSGVAAGLVLLVATLVVHGWSLSDGLFLDDHWHQKQLRERGWSWHDLLETATIQPDQFIETWWQDRPIIWKYARPASVALMKCTHGLFGGDVRAHHGVSLVLHYVNAVLIYSLCLWLTRHRFWSLVGGLLFVIYSHSVFAVGWLAAQNVVLQMTFMLLALVFYVRASGLSAWSDRHVEAADTTPPLQIRPFFGVVILTVLALLSRENAIMLPAILIAFDLGFGGRRHLWARRGPHAVLILLTAIYLVWRLGYFHHPLPDVYFRRPDGDESYLLWCLAKLMHYLSSAVWLSPMTIGPTGRYDPITEVPGDCALMATILAIMSVGYWLACRRAPGFWIWPLWLLLCFLPVVPIMATPHSGYPAGVAFSVAMILGPGLYQGVRPVSIGRWCRAVAIWFLIATSIYIPIYRTLWTGIIAAERCTLAALAAAPPPKAVTDAFFVNLPFVNIYTPICMERTWGIDFRDVRCHVLTYAPALLRMETPCIVEQLDNRRFTVKLENGRYFSGLLGRYLLDAMASSGPMPVGRRGRNSLFEVQVLEADSLGVRSLVFEFHRPLASAEYRFYLTTPFCAAAPLRFRRDPVQGPDWPLAMAEPSPDDIAAGADALAGGDAEAAGVLLRGAASPNPELRRQAWSGFRPEAVHLARGLGAPVQVLLQADPPDRAGLERINRWWRGAVDDETLEALWRRRGEPAPLEQTRQGLFTVRSVASMIIETDLYLTGPPYPGPR